MTCSISPTAPPPPAAIQGKRSFYRPELDILRFGAFLLVFSCHLMPGDAAHYQRLFGPGVIARFAGPAFRGGAYGVDLFFCLSSYLITTLLLKEHTLHGKIDIRSFYFRRILRIWPLYFAFLLVVVPLVGAVLPTQRLSPRFFLAFVTFFGNWACAAWSFPVSAAGILWSVSIEEQFYLTWPLVMKRWLGHLPRICWGLILLAAAARLALVFHGASRDAIFCNTLTRLDPIAAGALVAWYLRGRTPGFRAVFRVPMILLGFAGIFLCGALGSGGGVLALVTYPAATVASVLLLLGTLGTDLGFLWEPGRRLLIYLGRISYGLYVFHRVWLAIAANWIRFRHPSLGQFLLQLAFSLAGTVLVAGLSYRFLESPFLKMKDRWAHVATRRQIRSFVTDFSSDRMMNPCN